MEPTIFLGGKGRNRHSDFYVRCCRQCFAQLVNIFSDLSSLEATICFDVFLGRDHVHRWPCSSKSQRPVWPLQGTSGQSCSSPAISKENQRSSFPEAFFLAPGPVLRVR